MKHLVESLAFLIALSIVGGVAADTGSTGKYPNYTAAQRALARGDCDATVHYLNAYLHNHPSIKDKHKDFYLQLKIVIGQCTGAIRVRGMEDESVEIDPLPDHPSFDD
jgi:hypothetical protein